MDIECIVRGYVDRGKFVVNIGRYTWTSFIGQFVNPAEGSGGGIKGVDGAYRYFSQMLASLYQSTWKSGATSKK